MFDNHFIFGFYCFFLFELEEDIWGTRMKKGGGRVEEMYTEWYIMKTKKNYFYFFWFDHSLLNVEREAAVLFSVGGSRSFLGSSGVFCSWCATWFSIQLLFYLRIYVFHYRCIVWDFSRRGPLFCFVHIVSTEF